MSDGEGKLIRADPLGQEQKKGSLRTILESPFTLWVLTATFLPLIGLIFSERNSCLAEANTAGDHLRSLVTELAYRDSLFTTLVKQKNLPDAVKSDAPEMVSLLDGLSKVEKGADNDYLSADFKGKTTIDIIGVSATSAPLQFECFHSPAAPTCA